MSDEFKFSTEIVVGIGDINYGGHLSNDKYLVIFHEGRLRYLKQFGFSELNIGNGIGLIMSQAEIKYKAEAFWNDKLTLFVKISHLDNLRFDFDYLLTRSDDMDKVVATGKTRMVAFDYQTHKIKRIPDIFLKKIKAYEGI